MSAPIITIGFELPSSETLESEKEYQRRKEEKEHEIIKESENKPIDINNRWEKNNQEQTDSQANMKNIFTEKNEDINEDGDSNKIGWILLFLDSFL